MSGASYFKIDIRHCVIYMYLLPFNVYGKAGQKGFYPQPPSS